MVSHLDQFPAQVLWNLMIIKASRGEDSPEMREALKKKVMWKW
ncbi:TPA: hypothetical protein ACRZZI_004992 [Vibrio harveyi]